MNTNTKIALVLILISYVLILLNTDHMYYIPICYWDDDKKSILNGLAKQASVTVGR